MAQNTPERDDRGTQFRRIAPGSRMSAVTPNDDDDNCPANATLYVSGAGNIVIIPEGNNDADTVTLAVTDGQFIDQLTVRRVLATNTTATGIYAVH